MATIDKKSKGKNIESIYPLSPMQQGMLFHTLYAPETGVYFQQLICTLQGNLNIAAFEQAWQRVVERHAALRTAFVWENPKQSFQVVCKLVNIPWAHHDWRSLSSQAQEDALEAFLQADRDQGFELKQAPVMRCTLIKVADNTYKFIWSHHHLLIDGWSLTTIVQEVFAFYEAFKKGENLHLKVSRPYGDYISWLKKQDNSQAELYWQETLKGFTVPTSLTVEIPLTKRQQPSNYNTQQIKIAGIGQIQTFAKQNKLTLNNLIQGAWAILLSRYSGETDIIFGATVSGRPPDLLGVESMVGLFINTLPVRVTIPEDVEVLPWLKKLQAQQVESEQYSYSPLVEIQGWSEIPKGMPLFESIVAFENYPVEASIQEQDSNLNISHIRCIEQTNYPLTLLAVPGSELSINITYDSSRFEAATINRMLGHLQTLLIGIINQPHQRLWELPLLTKTELWQLLEEPHKTPTKQFPNQCIHELFELQVEQTPEAIAVIFENEQITYEQLNIKANQLAHYLHSLGVSADTLVGICVERSLEMIVGILGILKAGGAYVPLDPNYPQERLSFTLSDSQIKILLTQQQLLLNLPKNQAKVICIDSDWEIIAEHHPHNPPIFTTSASLAYIIYTSGSTGKPKGVLINHANVVRLFTATEDWFHFDQQDVWTMFHSYAFDFSVWEIWGALINGGRLVIVPYWVSRSPQDFYQLLSTQQVTVLNQTPSAFRQLISAEAIAKTSANLALRWVIFGGEALELQSLKPWFERHGDKMPKLVNMYGITETTVHVTYRPITNADLTSNAGSVIGCPIPDLQVYVLDKNRQLLPIGVTGEMYVGGAGLARGYLNREELTSNVFVTHPFSDDPNARLYKTGDLARYLGNGELEYLGRIDNQVKIRGFRIELGEIEAAISQHPLIQATVVIARVENNGDKRLVAYLVINQQQTLSINDIRQFLSSKLPQYMIPSAFVFLDTLPLTSNGKIDRRALPAPEPLWELEKSYVAPRTAIEGILTQIWTEVLGVEQVGIYDNFFELGGDSILSLQIIARANLAGVHLSPKQLFEHQAIAQLAAVAGTITQIQAQQGLVTGLVPLTPIQHWFFEQNQPEPHHYNQSVLLSVPSDLKPELLKRVLQQLLLHHDALRLQFTKAGGSWQQVNADFAETVPLHVVDLSTMSQTEQLKALEEAGDQLQASLNLSTGPIMAAALFELGRQTNRLLLTIHHLAVDGVSWRILLDDLQAGYQQICRGERIQLPPKTTSFQYWAQRLSEYAQSDILKDELAYWLNQSRKPVLPIPVDYIDGSNIVTSVRMVSVSLNTAQTQALLQEVPRAYNTQINDVLLTALAQVLSKWTGAKFVLLNLEGHGREDIFKDVDLSRTVGWFTTIFPVLLELGATDNLGNILKSIKEQLRQIPHKGVGYGVLRYLHQDAEIRQQLQAFPPAQISFNYLGQFDQALSTTADFQLTTESAGAVQSLNNFRSHLVDINAIIVNGQMQIDWTYSSNIHQQSTIETLANEFIQALQALIAHCLSPEVGGYTPSDFPLAKLTQAQLDTELGKIKYENIEDIYPLSPMQQGMLFHSLYAPESGVYFEQLSCTFQGKLEVGNFEQAWQQVIAKYSVFRTGFIWENHHQPLQVVYRQVKLPLVIDDWQGLSVTQQQDKLNIFLESEARRGFELSLAPLMRLSLIQLDANIYQFIWSHHHLLLDGWSLSLVLKEVFDCYEAICQGRNFRHEPSPVYRNYIAWLQQQDLAQAKVFWQQKLQGFSAPTLLTVDKPLTDRQQESNYSRQQIYLPQSVTAILQAFARQYQLTLNNLVQGAWALLLSRYSGEEDVVFGATVSGRPPELIGVESIVGLFINTLPVRVLVPSKGELLPWLKELQAQQLECEQYSYTPLVEIQGWSEIPPGMPLFESIVVFENYPVDAAVQQHNGNLQISDIRGSEQTNYPLTVSVVPGSQLSLNISYDTSRFESATITRMLGHLQTLLEGIATKPEQHLCQLPLLTISEQNQLLWEWNNTQKDYPQDRCVHQLFEQQVELTPDAVAVVFKDYQLTYWELNTRANQLAHYLQSLGVKPDVLVGICVERSLEMVVGLLGILKAGGAYVPLDPNYPSERLGYMLSDSQVSLLLTQQRLVERLPDHQAQVICLDSDWNLICQLSAENPISDVQAANLAYVIYTSGSTGQPKGVLIPHQGLLNLLFWHQRTFEITPHDRATQLAGTAFDASVWELWPYLSGGASIYLVPQAILSSLEGLRDWLICQQVTIAFLPTPLAEALLSVEWSDDCALRILLTGGDRLHHYPSASIPFQLVNNYGPTENTVVTTSGLVLPDEQQHTLPGIGRPIDNTQVYILDANLQPVPIGVPGELHIGGDSLARGYLHRTELTQEKFIPHPFAATDGQRLYKTGDLVRYLADGNIEYLGRIDNQVKIRGFRIELGEVENALSQHPSIKQVTVLVREDVPGDKRLVAYVVLQQDHVLTVSYLRQYLRETLPEYMITAAFIFLEALPLTSNGKVDRRALPIPDFRQELEVSFMAPRTPNEEILANIWADVLKVNRVGIYDNFFELGGDSILSLQIIARANQAGLQLSPKQLFEHPTIVELMTVVDTTKKIEAEQNLVTGLVPLTPIQHWAFEQNLHDLHHYNQSVLLSVPSDLKLEILESVFNQLLLHHDALRLRFTRDDGAWLQVNAGVEETISLSVIDLSTISSQEQRATLENIGNELQASLNLSTGPMLRAALFKFGTKEPSKLLAIAHHFVVDGVSWRILLEDLLNAYQQLSLDQTIQLPPKTTSFKYWAQRLSEYAQSDALLAESTYWLNVAAKQIPPIPVDYEHGVNTVAVATTVSFSLTGTDTQLLLQEVPKAYNTQINDVLLTALVQVIGKWTGSNLLLLDLEGHGREDLFADVDLSRTVGWFTTIFPVLLELESTENIAQILKSVKEQLRQIPHKGIGYGLLRYLCLDEQISQKFQNYPHAQISFNYLGQFDQAFDTNADFKLTNESAGAVQSLNNFRSHLLDINGMIVNGQLQIDWTYSSDIHQHATIANLAQEFIQTLRSLIVHCLSPDAGSYTPSDFPLAKLTQTQLDNQFSKTKYQNLEDIYPLSPMQQGMLFHSLYTPESGAYFEQLSFTLKGNLEISAFEQAWQQTISRHTIFRTGFIWENDDQPLQLVYRQVTLPLEIDDWRAYSASEQQEKLNIFREFEQQRSFQLSFAPLMRLILIQLDINTYQFILSYHHLLLDGWSLSLVFKEVFELYEAICQERHLRLEPIPAYRHYIAWLKQQDLAIAKVFWQQKLQGFTAPTPLMVDILLANQTQDLGYAEQKIYLSESTTNLLQTFAKQHQLTLNNLVQGAWSILLSRYSGETDVVFGVTVSGRPPELMGVESMVGLFINTLPARVTLSPEMELLSWLKQLQVQQVEYEQYSYTPLVDIQTWSEIPRGMPLFESIVVFENYPVDTAVQQHNGSLQVNNFQAGMEITDYPLTVTAVPGLQLFLSINYDTSRFDSATITRMLGHLQTLLAEMVTNQQQQLWQLPLLTSSEQQQLLWEWNATQKDYPQDRCIHELFELQAQLTPDAVAVVFETQQLTYRQLNARANQLAHYLRHLGVETELLVGVCLERSLEIVVAILGILKAGGAYLPLDPDYPPDRLGYMLSDSQVSLLLTQQQLIAKLPQHTAHIVCLDSDWHLIAQSSNSNLVNFTSANNLAYVIYTSGSTGQPKGVMVTHQSLVNAYFAWENAYQLRSLCTSHLQMASFSFDVFSGDVVRALCSGGKLVICPRELLLEPEKLYQLIQTQRIDCAEFVPAVLRNLIQYLDRTQQNLSGMKLLIVGSDSWSMQEYQQFRRFLGNQMRLINSYGVSEATIDSSYFETETVNLFSNKLVPIGRPFTNTQLYILDQYLQPVPIGVSGELYIGGAGVSRGYLNRPELTQEKFIPHPFSPQQGARLYKTGDLARYLPSGNIEYLERSDHQVKIRGFRIELGEIEALLTQHPQVQVVTVIVREDVPGDKRLVAYIVIKQEPAPTIDKLRQFLNSKLPHYMIPAAFVFLEALPLTPNGKIDRRALKPPESRPELEVSFVAATTSIEQQLASIWADVLRVEQVGIHDNFFELGGDSILSLQIISRTNQAGLQLSPKQLFEHPTIAELATVAGTAKKIQAQQGLVTGIVPLTPIQHWFFQQHQPQPHHYNQSVVLTVPSELKVELLNRVVQELLLHHDALRMRFVWSDGIWLQENTAFAENVSLTVVDLSDVSVAQQAIALENKANQVQASLNLSTGELMRVVLFAFGDNRPSRLLIVIHHLVVDGVSWRILLADLQTGYQQLLNGEEITLPAKTTSFQYWAQRLCEYAQSTALVSELNYWLTVSAANVTPLPVDYPRSQISNTIASSGYLSLSLNAEETRKLLQEAPAAYNTQINDVLLTALVQSFEKWTGSDSLLVDLEGHGREEILEDVDLSRTVGWFTSVFPIHLQLENEKHPGNALKLVKEQLRRLPMQGIGYGILRYLSQYADQLNNLPSAEVSFNYLGQFDRESSATETWTFAQESGGSEYDSQQHRSYLLEISGLVMNGEMQINWEYSEKVHHRSTVEYLAESFMESLRNLIQHCLSPNVGGFTPSDFPKAGLNQEELDDLLADIN